MRRFRPAATPPPRRVRAQGATVARPFAKRLATRLGRDQGERRLLLRRAFESSDAERRRIAGELHEGVMQDLAAVSYALVAVATEIEATVPAAASSLRALSEDTRKALRSLRSALVEIYPPSLHEGGLSGALGDLVEVTGRGGVATELAVQADVDLRPELEALLFRSAQEAVRNAVHHGHASHLAVELRDEDGRIVLTVTDDGVGFDAAAVLGGDATARRDGVGLRMLADLVRDAGGRLDIHSGRGRGTRLAVMVPAA